MSLKRTFLKARRASLPELFGRFSEKLRVSYERRLVGYRPLRNIASNGKLAGWCLDPRRMLASAANFAVGNTVQGFQQLEKTDPQTAARLVSSVQERINRLRSGRWSLLGHAWTLPERIAWHHDPLTGFLWNPTAFYADVFKQAGTEQVDVKYTWELGRQQFLVELSRGWITQHHEAVAAQAVDIIRSFIDENPCYTGVHWTSALEVAVRSINWTWTLAALCDWPGWDFNDLQLIVHSLAEHADYLAHHLSFYSSPYNHVIGESTGLLLLSYLLAEHPSAQRWQRLATSTLSHYAPRQYYRDGLSVEQAVGYHFYTLGFLLQAAHVHRLLGAPSGKLEETIGRATNAAIALRQPDNLWPCIGDVDSARAIPVTPDNFWDFSGICNLGGIFLQDAELICDPDWPGEEACWLLGEEAVTRWGHLTRGLKSTPAPGRQQRIPQQCIGRHFDDAGYIVLQADSDYCLFDVGHLGHGVYADATPSVSHGHADELSVVYFLDGEQVLFDSGCYSYKNGCPWKDYFRGETAHNSIAIEGLPLAVASRDLSWSRVAPKPDGYLRVEDGFCVAWGKSRRRSGTSIERHILFIRGRGIYVADYISLDQVRRIDWYWQIGSGTCLLDNSTNGYAAVIQLHNTFIAALANVPLKHVELVQANGSAPAGWRAIGYGQRLAGCRAQLTVDECREVLLVTHIGKGLESVWVQYKGITVTNSDTACEHGREFRCGELTWRLRHNN